MHISSTLFTLALAAAQAQVQAQDLNSTIVGCVEVECPGSSTDKTTDDCTIAHTGSFGSIGVTRIPVVGPNNTNTNTADAPALSGLSWTKGFNITALNSGRTFHSSFYLGAPPSLTLNDSTGACAIFMHGASGAISFPGDGPYQLADGTCADAMGSPCVDALVSRARTLVDGYNSGGNKSAISDVCEKLRKDLESSNDDVCSKISNGTWTNFTGTALTGNGAPQPITKQENTTSNCWPIIPKQDSLTLVSEYTVPGSVYADDMEKAQWAITPILTVFYPSDNGTLVSNTDASLTCVKVMGPERASLGTFSNGQDDHDNGAAALLSSHSLASASLIAGLATILAAYTACL
ncbi:uncharacterized protein F4822DRAFT_137903 [Hypoxylon trugodes]|uniref:uncharacterized protein n=1 Tax=Hypoxylon trugodes TaxID=326681 RepID=UPI00219E0238|nr:uncharacterized protein F4822DRAFT_137903 [Hypoxylon trugodes]KAI1392686.1 hypothetical protein F4822DRAFT_137903 [Hypoxylon trugodes]